jgi:hypothetical protein
MVLNLLSNVALRWSVNQINLGALWIATSHLHSTLHQNLPEIVVPLMIYVQGAISYFPAFSEIIHHICSMRAMISHCIAIKTSVNAPYVFAITLVCEVAYSWSLYCNICALINLNNVLQMLRWIHGIAIYYKKLFASVWKNCIIIMLNFNMLYIWGTVR